MNAERQESTIRIVAKIARGVAAGQSWDSYADLVDAVKHRLSQLRIDYAPHEITEALRLIESNHPLLRNASCANGNAPRGERNAGRVGSIS